MALAVGETGWLELDASGAPTGEAMPDPPALGIPSIAVKGVEDDPLATLPAYSGLLTLTGAPITPVMLPHAEMWDEGMLTRNPIPPEV